MKFDKWYKDNIEIGNRLGQRTICEAIWDYQQDRIDADITEKLYKIVDIDDVSKLEYEARENMDIRVLEEIVGKLMSAEVSIKIKFDFRK